MFESSTARILSDLEQWIAGSPAGARLPTTRRLVERYRASPVTIQRVLHTLVTRGVIETRPGAGTFVLKRHGVLAVNYSWQTGAIGPRTPASGSLSSSLRSVAPGVISLHAGYPEDELLPLSIVRSAFRRVGDEQLATRPPAPGLPQLRSWFAAELAIDSPSDLQPPTCADVIIVPGSQSGLSAAFRALVGPGEPLVVESPTYWGALLAARQAQVRIVPIPVGPEGPDPDELERAFTHFGARAFYAQPNFANPTGAVWSVQARRRTLEIVEQRRAFVIEDDWARDFGIGARSVPLASLDRGGHVVHIRSLTKSVSPSVRIAAVTARGPAYDRILAESQSQSMYVSGALQAVAHDVVSRPAWRTHLRGLSSELRRRRDTLLAALQQHPAEFTVETIPNGGLNLWVRLSRDLDTDLLVTRCEQAGVGIGPGGEYFPAEPPGTYMRLNYSGRNPESFPEGVDRIARTIADLT